MRCVRLTMAVAAVAVLAWAVPLGALAPQGPPAQWTMTPADGPAGTEVTVAITYGAGITVWCTEEVPGAPSPAPGEPGWSVALVLTGPDGTDWVLPAGWSRTTGTEALPMGPLPAGDTATVSFVVPDTVAPGTYTGVGGCVSPDGAQPGPGLANVTFTVTASDRGPGEAAVATPRYTG
jgi:hypothetical protein